MQGVIINQGAITKFRDNETNKHYLVVGAFDKYANLNDDFYFDHLEEVEAILFENGTVAIKFSPK
jgi:hypothetical protein